jgi:hypothetical protein
MASGRCVPHQQAAHMAAPTEGQNVKNPLPTESRPHMAQSGRWSNGRFRPKADIPASDTSSPGADTSPNRK